MAENKDFTCEIIYSSRELSHKEKVKMKDTQNASSINELVADAKAQGGDGVIIDVDSYAVLQIHNEKATPNKDYQVVVIVDKNGDKFTTGSEAFMRQFKSIMDEMEGAEEDWSLKVYGRASKNYTGRDFITCSVL